MQSLDEEMKEIKKRETSLRKRQQDRRTALFSGLSGAACIALLVATMRLIPLTRQATVNGVPVYYGTVLFDSPVAGLAIIILLSFALGVSVTLLCRALRKLRKGRDKK